MSCCLSNTFHSSGYATYLAFGTVTRLLRSSNSTAPLYIDKKSALARFLLYFCSPLSSHRPCLLNRKQRRPRLSTPRRRSSQRSSKYSVCSFVRCLRARVISFFAWRSSYFAHLQQQLIALNYINQAAQLLGRAILRVAFCCWLHVL